MVTSVARRMVTQYGMSDKLGLVAYDSDQPVFVGMEYGHSEKTYSQETAAAIDAEVRRLTSEAHARATELLKENRSILDNMARVLVEKETIYTEEVEMLMKGASWQEVIEAMDKNSEARIKDPFAKMVKPETEEKTEAPAETSQSLEELADEAMKKLSGDSENYKTEE